MTQIESRGQMASGFAFGYDGQVGYHKDKVAGSNLRLKGLPRDAKTVIAHTRFATHGTVNDNRNNHPVLSPNNKIALVHNGVIWNHDSVRRNHLEEFDLPDVDTSVIPAIIQKFGLAGVEHLSGDAAVAWLDSANPDVLNLARLESSPMSFTQLLDGSIVFASLTNLLTNALATMGLEHGAVLVMDERAYYQLEFGKIIKVDQSPELTSFMQERWWSNATAGGHGDPKHTTIGRKPFVNKYGWDDEDGDYDGWQNGGTEYDLPTAATTAMALLSEPLESPSFQGSATDDLYYTVDHNGDFKSYRTLDGLENDLKWHAGIANDHGDAQFGGEGLARWMEYFLDVGSFGFGADEMISWVDEPGEIAYHENHADQGLGLGYIRDGISILQKIDTM